MIGSDGLRTINLPKYKTIIRVAERAPSNPKFLGNSLDFVISQEKNPKPMAATPNVKSPLGSIWLGKPTMFSVGGFMALAKS